MLYRTHLHPHPHLHPSEEKLGMHFPRAGWSGIWVTPSWATKKNQLPGVKWNLCFSRIYSPPVESQTSGTHCLIQHYSPFLSRCPKGNLIKSKSQNINRPHLKILLQVSSICLFDADWGRMVENQELWEDDGPHSSSTAGCFPVGATGDLGPVFAFLGIPVRWCL